MAYQVRPLLVTKSETGEARISWYPAGAREWARVHAGLFLGSARNVGRGVWSVLDMDGAQYCTVRAATEADVARYNAVYFSK